jgi:hypothetical protein
MKTSVMESYHRAIFCNWPNITCMWDVSVGASARSEGNGIHSKIVTLSLT